MYGQDDMREWSGAWTRYEGVVHGRDDMREWSGA